jgi:hypothetical protein
MCFVNFQPEEEMGCSPAAEDSCDGEILIFGCLDNIWIVVGGG